ncbi:MAG: DUF92 domain-containing protein, partial [Clostridia bacterium]|nr:DUF92 domain-containing protein [Clostridia bacterium]
FCTSLGDGLAGLMGQLMSCPRNAKIYGNKTIYGTLYNVVVSSIVVGCFNSIFDLGMSMWFVLAVAAFSTILELFTGRGLDNISITLGTAFLSYALINYPGVENYLAPILLTPIIIAFAYKKTALTVGGIIAALAVDIIISITLGNSGFLLLLAFFAFGIVTDKVKKRYKKTKQNKKEPAEKRGDCRDQIQVLANSLIATICAIFFGITHNRIFVLAFAASLAEALADTVASGIGVLNPKAYDLFRMKPCKPGISGGMSILGTLSSLFASLLMAIFASLLGLVATNEIAIVMFCAFLGGIFDSFLGSLAQVKYSCTVCRELVEREEHCGKPTTHHSGLKVMSNDLVNLLGTAFSAILALILVI